VQSYNLFSNRPNYTATFLRFNAFFFARKGKKGKTGGRIGRFLTEKARTEGKEERGKNTSRTEGKQMSRRGQQRNAYLNLCFCDG
jgi:hypothetical protein